MTENADQFEISAHPKNASLARERVLQAARAAGFPADALSDIEIAVGEAVTNAILYGSPTDASRIVISCRFAPPDGNFEVEVRDAGRGFDPGYVRDDDVEALGGRGLLLMRALMDSVLLQYDGNGMIVRLVKKK